MYSAYEDDKYGVIPLEDLPEKYDGAPLSVIKKSLVQYSPNYSTIPVANSMRQILDKYNAEGQQSSSEDLAKSSRFHPSRRPPVSPKKESLWQSMTRQSQKAEKSVKSFKSTYRAVGVKVKTLVRSVTSHVIFDRINDYFMKTIAAINGKIIAATPSTLQKLGSGAKTLVTSSIGGPHGAMEAAEAVGDLVRISTYIYDLDFEPLVGIFRDLSTFVMSLRASSLVSFSTLVNISSPEKNEIRQEFINYNKQKYDTELPRLFGVEQLTSKEVIRASATQVYYLNELDKEIIMALSVDYGEELEAKLHEHQQKIDDFYVQIERDLPWEFVNKKTLMTQLPRLARSYVRYSMTTTINDLTLNAYEIFLNFGKMLWAASDAKEQCQAALQKTIKGQMTPFTCQAVLGIAGATQDLLAQAQVGGAIATGGNLLTTAGEMYGAVASGDGFTDKLIGVANNFVANSDTKPGDIASAFSSGIVATMKQSIQSDTKFGLLNETLVDVTSSLADTVRKFGGKQEKILKLTGLDATLKANERTREGLIQVGGNFYEYTKADAKAVKDFQEAGAEVIRYTESSKQIVSETYSTLAKSLVYANLAAVATSEISQILPHQEHARRHRYNDFAWVMIALCFAALVYFVHSAVGSVFGMRRRHRRATPYPTRRRRTQRRRRV